MLVQMPFETLTNARLSTRALSVAGGLLVLVFFGNKRWLSTTAPRPIKIFSLGTSRM